MTDVRWSAVAVLAVGPEANLATVSDLGGAGAKLCDASSVAEDGTLQVCVSGLCFSEDGRAGEPSSTSDRIFGSSCSQSHAVVLTSVSVVAPFLARRPAPSVAASSPCACKGVEGTTTSTSGARAVATSGTAINATAVACSDAKSQVNFALAEAESGALARARALHRRALRPVADVELVPTTELFVLFPSGGDNGDVPGDSICRERSVFYSATLVACVPVPEAEAAFGRLQDELISGQRSSEAPLGSLGRQPLQAGPPQVVWLPPTVGSLGIAVLHVNFNGDVGGSDAGDKAEHAAHEVAASSVPPPNQAFAVPLAGSQIHPPPPSPLQLRTMQRQGGVGSDALLPRETLAPAAAIARVVGQSLVKLQRGSLVRLVASPCCIVSPSLFFNATVQGNVAAVLPGFSLLLLDLNCLPGSEGGVVVAVGDKCLDSTTDLHVPLALVAPPLRTANGSAWPVGVAIPICTIAKALLHPDVLPSASLPLLLGQGVLKVMRTLASAPFSAIDEGVGTSSTTIADMPKAWEGVAVAHMTAPVESKMKELDKVERQIRAARLNACSAAICLISAARMPPSSGCTATSESAAAPIASSAANVAGAQETSAWGLLILRSGQDDFVLTSLNFVAVSSETFLCKVRQSSLSLTDVAPTKGSKMTSAAAALRSPPSAPCGFDTFVPAEATVVHVFRSLAGAPVLLRLRMHSKSRCCRVPTLPLCLPGNPTNFVGFGTFAVVDETAFQDGSEVWALRLGSSVSALGAEQGLLSRVATGPLEWRPSALQACFPRASVDISSGTSGIGADVDENVAAVKATLEVGCATAGEIVALLRPPHGGQLAALLGLGLSSSTTACVDADSPLSAEPMTGSALAQAKNIGESTTPLLLPRIVSALAAPQLLPLFLHLVTEDRNSDLVTFSAGRSSSAGRAAWSTQKGHLGKRSGANDDDRFCRIAGTKVDMYAAIQEAALLDATWRDLAAGGVEQLLWRIESGGLATLGFGGGVGENSGVVTANGKEPLHPRFRRARL